MSLMLKMLPMSFLKSVKKNHNRNVLQVAFVQKIFLVSLVIILGMFITSCYFIDPALDGEVSERYSVPWTPYPCKEIHHSPTSEEEEQAEEDFLKEGQPWHVETLIDIALRNNPETRYTWENARAAAFSWRASRSILYPNINLTEQLLIQKIVGVNAGGVATANTVGIVNSGTTNNDIVVPSGAGAAGITSGRRSVTNQWFISTLSFSYLMLDFGGRMASIESAREALFAADWTHNRNIQTVMLNVLTSYYQHLEAMALVAARELDLKESQENLTSAEQQFDAGVVTIVDVLQAKSAYVNIQYQLEQLRGSSRTTLGQLATAMGMPPNAQFEIAALPEDLQMEQTHQDIEELIQMAKAERPDLAAAEANWKEQEANVRVAWSSGMPTLNANAIVQDTDNIHFSSLNSRYYSGSILLNVPIFSGFFYVNQTRRAKAIAAAAYAQWKSQEENALLEVVISFSNFETAVQQVKFADENYHYAYKAYEAALANYKFGTNTILDVLSAEAALSNARAQRIQSRTFWITSLTNIAYSTGTL